MAAAVSAADELVRAVNSARTAIANGELLKGLATLLSLIGSTPSLAELLEGDVVGCLRDLSEALLPHHAGASVGADADANNASAPAANAPADVAKLRYLFANTRRALPRSADLRHNEGAMLHRAGEHRNAIACFEAALALEPGHAAAAESLESLRSFAAERWHFRMLNDRERNSEYDRAIRRAVARLRARSVASAGAQPVTVLDIGAGTGILSMMAARAGADRVYGCEMNPLLCEVARETVGAAGYSDRVAMLQCHSTMLSVAGEGLAGGSGGGGGGGGGGGEASPTMLPSRADLIVTELVDSGLVGGRSVSAAAAADPRGTPPPPPPTSRRADEPAPDHSPTRSPDLPTMPPL